VVSGYQEAALIGFPVVDAGIVLPIRLDDNLFFGFWPHDPLSGTATDVRRLV